MFRFRLGSIPVEVHYNHLLFSALLAYLLAYWAQPSMAPPERWPSIYLLDPSHPLHARTLLICLVLWMVILFLAALVHELGHAITSRAFGYRPRIMLFGLSSHTQVGSDGAEIPWHRNLLVNLAGPPSNLLLAISGQVLQWGLHGRSQVADYALDAVFRANLLWAVLNLVPILPFAGGRAVHLVLVRLLGRQGAFMARALSTVLVTGAIVFSLQRDNVPLALLLLLCLFRSLFAMEPSGLGPSDRQSPGERAFTLAQQSYREGDLDQAKRRCLLLVDDDETPRSLRSRAHHLLGWVAVKEGKGRTALDHFSQVGEHPLIERQALAAAFSLIGDEPRALALWDLAYWETRDRTVLHEWAGSFIRAGKVEQARKLPGVDMALAYTCALRVLLIREDFVRAAQVGLMALAEHPNAQVAYDTACALARAGDKGRAVEMLQRAAALGFSDLEYASTDADLAPLHGDAAFSSWLASLKESPRS